MAKKISGPQILTANLLRNGTVVFLGDDGSWQEKLGGARLGHSETDIAQLEAKGDEASRVNLIVDPYLIEVEEAGSTLTPVELRERMRARGPDINFGRHSNINEQVVVAA